MKKLITIGTLLVMLAGVCRAQNSEALIDQVGRENRSVVVQEGLKNTADILQEEGHTLFLTQKGSKNSAFIRQHPYHGNGVILPFPPGNGNPPPFNGNGLKTGYGAYAELLQEGQLNFVDILQLGNHWTKVTQKGSQNEAEVEQSGASFGIAFNPPGVSDPCPPPFGNCDGQSSEGSVSSIIQEGLKNKAAIKQDGSHWANIQQYGNRNTADIIQMVGEPPLMITGLSLLPGVTFSAQIIQFNDWNTARIEQYKQTASPIIIEQWGHETDVEVVHH
jgi:hypothetical protein